MPASGCRYSLSACCSSSALQARAAALAPFSHSLPAPSELSDLMACSDLDDMSKEVWVRGLWLLIRVLLLFTSHQHRAATAAAHLSFRRRTRSTRHFRCTTSPRALALLHPHTTSRSHLTAGVCPARHRWPDQAGGSGGCVDAHAHLTPSLQVMDFACTAGLCNTASK